MQFCVQLPSVDRTFIGPCLQAVQHHHGVVRARVAVVALCVLTIWEALVHATAATGKWVCLAIQNSLPLIVWGSKPITSMVEIKSHAARTAKLLKAVVCVTPRALMNPDYAVQAYEKLGLSVAAPSAVQRTVKTLKRVVIPTLLTAAIAIPLFYTVRLWGRTIKDFFGNVDANENMAEEIRNLEELSRLKSINGISISTIEQRARPGAWSHSGFLGPEESFTDVLQQDWATVKNLGTTHMELAKRLQTIFDNAPDCGAFLPFQMRDGQLLRACKVRTMGCQADLFGHNQESSEGCWGTDLLLQNWINGEWLQVGEGVIRYIRKYGFYEGGGSGNPYRIDPTRLVSLLTGYGHNAVVPGGKFAHTLAPNVFLEKVFQLVQFDGFG